MVIIINNIEFEAEKIDFCLVLIKFIFYVSVDLMFTYRILIYAF